MKNMYTAVKLILDHFGLNSVETFKDRTIIQKKFYLAQELGLKTGLGFIWGVKGPYSEMLSDIAINIMANPDSYKTKMKLGSKALEILDEVKRMTDNYYRETLELAEHEWLILITTIHYMSCYSEYKSKDEIISAICQKKQFSINQALSGWEVLEKHGLLRTEEKLERLQKKVILICGDRHWDNYDLMIEVMQAVKDFNIIVVEGEGRGEGRGAGKLAKRAARLLNLEVRGYTAHWNIYMERRLDPYVMTRCSILRSLKWYGLSIIIQGASKETADCISKAQERGIETRLITENNYLEVIKNIEKDWWGGSK